MTPAERLLQAAKRCEIKSLEHLANTCGVVTDISRFIHALQKERGASNIYLTSRGQYFVTPRKECILVSQESERIMRDRLETLARDDGRPAASARLLERIARLWYALDGLGDLRQDIDRLRLGADETTLVYNRLISGLLEVVFDAADTADDPQIARALVAIFHFMQGKELAGQERACGAIGFTAGHFDSAHRQLLFHLIDAQQRCFDTFTEFASPEGRRRWEGGLPPRTQAGIQQLREMSCNTIPRVATKRSLGETWYDLTTRRIDAMKQIEDTLADELTKLCRDKIDRSCREIADLDALRDSPTHEQSPLPLGQQQAGLLDAPPADELDPPAGRARDSRLPPPPIEQMRAQASRLQDLSDELATTRTALRERTPEAPAKRRP